MNSFWSKAHILIATVCAAFAGGCTVEVIEPEEEEEVGETRQALTGGGTCNSNDPNWPHCNGGGGPTLPQPECSGKPACYCICRVHNPCAQNPAACNALSACLNQCDASYPFHCAGGGNPNPRSAADCF
ncbi:hypothetical protein [Chondromyces apiculatus]|uniref:Secreted protein n=1 Tax=Chondromyces apiculatus DSM 436 TaxID=1192034 RepID=A0A017TH23_9BACT|nr:hypothetical protein [Chondromyces apiculatus]EYF08115.1 Hypothetical protein CAP_5875 [Chondromyces apiculatus DSM 436]